MALWDSADLLARVKREARIPTVTEYPTDADLYAWITEGHAYWYDQVAIHAPYVLMGTPQQMTTGDSGVTYSFPSETEPIAVQVFTAIDGIELKAGSYDDPSSDYVWEGSQIRMPQSKARTFTTGPYARWITPPTTIDGSTQPTLKPARARILAAYRACALYASAGDLLDPGPFYALEEKEWFGNPAAGDYGMLGALKNLNEKLGRAAWRRATYLSGRDYLRAFRR